MGHKPVLATVLRRLDRTEEVYRLTQPQALEIACVIFSRYRHLQMDGTIHDVRRDRPDSPSSRSAVREGTRGELGPRAVAGSSPDNDVVDPSRFSRRNWKNQKSRLSNKPVGQILVSKATKFSVALPN